MASKRQSRGERACGRRQRIAGHVPPGHVQFEACIAGVRPQLDVAAVSVQRAARGDIGPVVEAEIHHRCAGGARGCTPDVRVRVAGVDDCGPARAQREDRVRMLGGDLLHAGHELLMFALCIVDDRDRRLRDRAQVPCLAAMVHAEFDDGRAMRVPQSEQCQRQPDGVVEIPLRDQHARIAEMGAEDRRGHFLDGRLAVAAHDDRQRDVELRPPEACETSEREQRIRDGDQVALHRRCAIGGDQSRGGALRQRRGNELVTVEMLALQRDEQIAGFKRAAVGDDAPERDVLADQLSIHSPRGRFRIHHAAVHAAKATAATAMSENGVRTPLRS